MARSEHKISQLVGERAKCVTCGLETTKKYTDLDGNKFTACSGLCADLYIINSNFSIESEVKTNA